MIATLSFRTETRSRSLAYWMQCRVMPSVSPSVGVTSSHLRHHLATTVASGNSSSSGGGIMSTSSLHQQPAGREQLLSRTNLYIRGLKPETTDKDLVTLCQQSVLYLRPLHISNLSKQPVETNWLKATGDLLPLRQATCCVAFDLLL